MLLRDVHAASLRFMGRVPNDPGRDGTGSKRSQTEQAEAARSFEAARCPSSTVSVVLASSSY